MAKKTDKATPKKKAPAPKKKAAAKAAPKPAKKAAPKATKKAAAKPAKAAVKKAPAAKSAKASPKKSVPAKKLAPAPKAAPPPKKAPAKPVAVTAKAPTQSSKAPTQPSKAPTQPSKPAPTVPAAKKSSPKPPEKVAKKPAREPAPEPAELETPAEETTVEEIVLTDAEGRRYCRVKDCDQVATVDGYCRFHYLLYWKKIQIRKKILSEGKLERYVEDLTARYPDKFLDMLRKDLRSEKEFLAAIQELEIDESSTEGEFEDESANYIEEVRGMGDAGGGRGGGDEEDF